MRIRFRSGAALAVALLISLSCGGTTAFAGKQRAVVHPISGPPQWNHEWARGAVFYEVFVRSFFDSGTTKSSSLMRNGDLQGLISKLDYLNDGNPATTSDLGIDAIWLMPVFQSPSYHGYDITDYETIEEDYGTNADFQRLLTEAHKRGIRVILDLVMNHTSVEHPWFKDSASSTTAPHRRWYVWSSTNPGWVQPWGGNNPTWYALNGYWYYGVFWSGMPDLNYLNPDVRKEMFRIARQWLAAGVDGFRLDATRYLIETGPGPGQADTPQTHQLLKDFAADVRQVRPDAVLVAENTVDTPTLATYYGSTDVIAGGDEMPMNFNFPLAAAIVQSVNGGSAAGIRKTLAEMRADYPPGVIDAPFLTNHDQTRLATQLGNDPGKLRDAAAILLTLPGAPFIYYGEEVGLQNGPSSDDMDKRTPMPWTATGGFTTGTPWFHYAPGTSTANVAAETSDPQSLLSYYRNWIAARKRSTALKEGDLTLLDSSSQILAFVRNSGSERVLVVHNLSAASVTTGALAVQASGLDPIYADAGVTAPSGGANAWVVTLPPHSSGAWRIR